MQHIRRLGVPAVLALATMTATTSNLKGQAREIVIAVLPLENAGSYGKDRESFDALRKGLAAILASELALNPDLRVVGRIEVQRVLDQQGLAGAERLDRETAARIGKLVAARYLVTGSFIDLYGDFRIDARLVNTETGEIVRVVRSDPTLHDRVDMYRMLQSVAQRIGTGPPLPAMPAGAATGARQLSAEALAAYSLGLLSQDRGDRAKAREFYQKALALYPGFTEASEALRSVSP